VIVKATTRGRRARAARACAAFAAPFSLSNHARRRIGLLLLIRLGLPPMNETLLRLGRRSMRVIQLSVYVSRGISHFRLVNFDLLDRFMSTTFEYPRNRINDAAARLSARLIIRKRKSRIMSSDLRFIVLFIVHVIAHGKSRTILYKNAGAPSIISRRFCKYIYLIPGSEECSTRMY